jgi:2-dehydropantoate 2-reductase
MRFVVLGAGAIGGVLGGCLTEYGHEVVLIARGEHFDAMSRGGLRLESPDETITLPVLAVESPAAIDFREDDVVILATRTQGTAEAIRALASVGPATLPIFCAQNGGLELWGGDWPIEDQSSTGRSSTTGISRPVFRW